MSTPGPEPDRADPFSKPVRLARAVLDAAVEQDWGKAKRVLERLTRECDADGLGLAFVVWCDALGEHANDGPFTFGRIRVMDVSQETGARLAELTPAQRWTNQLVAARAAGDKEAFGELLDELSAIGDGMERGRYASALITAVAGTIRALPRGYARMGRTPPHPEP